MKQDSAPFDCHDLKKCKTYHRRWSQTIVLASLGLFCPKCKREYLVNVKQFKIQIVNEPDAKTQS